MLHQKQAKIFKKSIKSYTPIIDHTRGQY